MERTLSFGDVLEAVDRMSLEEQETLVDILNRRMVEERRAALARDIQEARQECQEGECRPVTPDELMGEIVS